MTRFQIDLSKFAITMQADSLQPQCNLVGLVVFLASVHASYITGATINVDGGKFHSIT